MTPFGPYPIYIAGLMRTFFWWTAPIEIVLEESEAALRRIEARLRADT